MPVDPTRSQILKLSSFCTFAFFSSHLITVAIALAVLSGVVLPANLLTTQRFHHDEALYATWALQIVSGVDPWLARTPIDKPPLFLYLVAGAMSWLGTTEAAARAPSLLATACTILLTFSFGRRLYGTGLGILAAWLVALSPFTLLFAPTAFTDPLLVAVVLASCLAAAYGRAGWAGVGLGLAMATKQQGIFFAPLVIALLTICDIVPCGYLRFTSYVPRLTSLASRFLLALLLTLLPVFVWQLNRNPVPDFLTRSLVNYGGLTGDTASFTERWWGFVDLLYYGTASKLLNGIWGVGLPVLLTYGLRTGRKVTPEHQVQSFPVGPPTAANLQPSNLPTFLPSNSPTFPLSHPPTLQPYSDWLFALFTLLFLLGHTLFSFQVWDRYLLGLIPFLALLLARILLLPWVILKNLWLNARPGWQPLVKLAYGLTLAGLLALTLARPVQDAVNGRYPLGSHSQALSGIEQIVAYLQGHVGANHTLYHRWLGPHWRFYLAGYPYDLLYWASPQELAAKAKPGHLIAFPSWQSDTEARFALAKAGLELKELSRAYNPAGYPSLVLYQIVSR